ncbi:GGDEF domain-containing protein [Aquabacterium sp.]|uniref:GGDEF domain-containing protein n=1 Tax=Aquabacterium sp. TaxID=1872578 RepID=UPI002B70C664|nr:diguanylate cyclase [Aquabacterium sp.]HSW03239.1 diguanylate cyclase [Aquabacterium sp.]
MNLLSQPAEGAGGVLADAVAGSVVSHALGQALLALAAQQGWMVSAKDAADGRYLYVNASMADFLGRPAEQVLGHHDAELIDAALASLLRTADQTALAQGSALASDHKFDWQGERREWSVLRSVSQAAGRRVLCSVWQDLSTQRQREVQLKAAIEQLEQQQKANVALRREFGDQGLRDQATGLSTRAHFDDQMRREVDLSTREHREFALVYMELDPLTDKARAFGERAMERIHESMGRLLRGNTRAMDASCRIDDRRFAVLLSGVGLATAHSRMEGLRRQCATQIIALDGQEVGFTVSMGVASYPHTAHSQEDVIAACEAALTAARRRGGNSVALASIRFG